VREIERTDPLPSSRAPKDKKIRRTNAKHHDRVAIQAIKELTP